MRIRRAYADCRDGQIHYRKVGRPGTPVLCLLHGLDRTGAVFEPLMALMQDRFTLHAFDLPGSGASDAPRSIDTIGDLADRLIEAIFSLGIARFHGCGIAAGAQVALEIAARQPRHAASLTLIEPFSDTARHVFASSGAGNDAARCAAALQAQDFDTRFGAAECPLQIVCTAPGTAHHGCDRAAALRPDAIRATLPAADGDALAEPEALAEALRRFIDTLES
ncbi:MAG: alpha/beta fold hydrolase [Gammaproteobacteria bacterium]